MSRYADSISALEDTTSRLGLPTTTYAQFLSQLKIHAESLDLQAKARRQANNTNSSSGNRSSTGRGNGGRGSGGRGNDKQGGRGRGRGNDNKRRPSSNGHSDPTDPSIYLSTADYNALSAEQKNQRYQRKQGHPSTPPTRRVNQYSQGRSNGEPEPPDNAPQMHYSDVSTITSRSTPPPTFI